MHQLVLSMVNLYTKFDVLSFIFTKDRMVAPTV